MWLSLVDLFKLDSYSIISFIEAVADPIFPTTTPEAKFANFTASSIFLFDESANPSEARTVSPAPVTSNTSLATVGWIRNSLSNIATPSSLRVIRDTLRLHCFLRIWIALRRLLPSLIEIFDASLASFLLGVSR